MSTAFDRGWGHPDERNYRKLHIAECDAGGETIYVRTEIRYLVAGFINELVANGYKIDKGPLDDWGYINRPIRGYETQWAKTRNLRYKSNHSWGLAFDINSRTNPLTTNGKLITDMPKPLVRHLCRKWGFTWGGDYTGLRKDAMHFEFMGRPSDVKKYPLAPVKKAA